MESFVFNHSSLESVSGVGTREGHGTTNHENNNPCTKEQQQGGLMQVTPTDLPNCNRETSAMDLQQLFPPNASAKYLVHQASMPSACFDDDSGMNSYAMYQPTQLTSTSSSSLYASSTSSSSPYAITVRPFDATGQNHNSANTCTIPRDASIGQDMLQTEANNADMLSVLSALSSSTEYHQNQTCELAFATADLPTSTTSPPEANHRDNTRTSPIEPAVAKTSSSRKNGNSPVQRKLCSVEGCQSQARNVGRCKKHGGAKRCVHPGCTKSVQSRGLCIRHGGGSRCREEGCTRAAQSHGHCKMHGGGRLCVVPECEKRAHLKGLCRRHGGGSKCQVDGCGKWAQRQGYCMTHSKEYVLPSEPQDYVI